MMTGADNMRFIYVFSEPDKQLLVGLGYRLLKEDNNNSMYIFENNNTLCFSKDEVKFVYSDVLSF